MAQNKIDFSEIKKSTEDKNSPYYYERLVYKFRGMPQAIDSVEASHFYYGTKFSTYRLETKHVQDFKNFGQAFQTKNFEETIKLGEALHFVNPSNLEVILILLQSYEQVQDQNNFMLMLQKFRIISATVLTSGLGDNEKSPYVVNTVGEEYVLLNLLKIPFQNYKRTSKLTKDGMMDVWKDGQQTVYINVVGYDD